MWHLSHRYPEVDLTLRSSVFPQALHPEGGTGVVELDKDKMWHSLKKVPPNSGYGKRNVVIGPNAPHSLPDFRHGLFRNTRAMPTPITGERPPERHTVGKPTPGILNRAMAYNVTGFPPFVENRWR